MTKKDILPTSQDYTVLSMQILAHIDSIMSVCNEIPSIEEVKQLLAASSSDGPVFVADARISKSYGCNLRTKLSDEVASVQLEVEEMK